jgi:hypothetical protein
MDTQQLLLETDLRLLAEEAGARFNSRDSSHCPLHPGSDNPAAFHIYRGQDGRQLWHCFTRCPEGENSGDAIAFYMRWRGVDFKIAIHELAERVGMNDRSPAPQSNIVPATDPPGDRWQARAAEFVAYAQGQLWQSERALAYLHEMRGYTKETIRTWGLGYNPGDVWDKPDRWGLDDKKVWCARGIVFPDFREGKLWSVNVRRPRPGDDLARYIGPVDRIPDLKFMGIRGGQRALFGADRLRGVPILFLVEGEPDAILAWQAIHDLADVATLGGARHHIDTHDVMLLARSWIILAILDTDEAGAKGIAYLKQVSRRVFPLEPPDHDLTDYWRHGGDLRGWLAAQIIDQAVAASSNDLQPEVADRWLAAGEQALEILLNSPIPTAPSEPVQPPLLTEGISIQLADLDDYYRQHHLDAARVMVTDNGLALV